jgi:hypothetical protein
MVNPSILSGWRISFDPDHWPASEPDKFLIDLLSIVFAIWRRRSRMKRRMLKYLELERDFAPLPSKVSERVRSRAIGGFLGHTFALLGFRPHFFRRQHALEMRFLPASSRSAQHGSDRH